jgi:hypothetical protein
MPTQKSQRAFLVAIFSLQADLPRERLPEYGDE